MSDDRAPDPTATDDDLLPDHAATDDQPDREVEPPAEDVAAADAAAARADDPADAANAPADEAVVQPDQVQDGAPDTGTPGEATDDDGIEELSADVLALDDGDPDSAGAFDDSSSVVESDQTDTGVIDDAGDGGDEHARDQAVHDLDDDHDGLESPDR